MSYSVPGVSCEHCRTAISAEVSVVEGVRSVEVDLLQKRVLVGGEDVRDAEIRAAIDQAGYDVEDD